jgi:hypothetical protein
MYCYDTQQFFGTDQISDSTSNIPSKSIVNIRKTHSLRNYYCDSPMYVLSVTLLKLTQYCKSVRINPRKIYLLFNGPLFVDHSMKLKLKFKTDPPSKGTQVKIRR